MRRALCKALKATQEQIFLIVFGYVIITSYGGWLTVVGVFFIAVAVLELFRMAKKKSGPVQTERKPDAPPPDE